MTVPALRVVEPLGPEDELLAEWEMFGVVAGWSEATIKMRRAGLSLLRRYAGVPLSDVPARELARWLSTFEGRNTRRTYFDHARSYYSWLHKMGYRDDDPSTVVPRPPTPRGVPKPITTRQLEDALTVGGRTARAYILLAAYAGLRVHEVAKVRGEDLDLDAGTLRVVGKGSVEAVVPLHPRIATASRGRPDHGWWFPGGRGNIHVRSTSVSQHIKLAFANAGHEMHAHQLRHWFGTQVLRSSGGNLRVAQECMRHASPATTAAYTRVEDSQRTAAVRGLPG